MKHVASSFLSNSKRLIGALLCSIIFTTTFISAGPMPRHQASYHFINGLVFNGETFEAKDFYAVDGVFRSSFSGRVDSTIDLQHHFIIPPFADAHNHLLADGMDAEKQLATLFAHGIFYLKNPNNTIKLTAPIREKVNTPQSIDVAYANGGLTAPGGHPIQIYEMFAQHPGWQKEEMAGQAYFVVDSETALAELWPRILAGKPDFIKTYLEHAEEFERRQNDPAYFGKRGLDPALLPEIVALAHRHGLRVSTHVTSAADFNFAVQAGVDEINHLPLELLQPADAQAAAQAGVTIVTTTLSHRPSEGIDDLDRIHRQNLRLLQNTGVKLVVGTDNGDLTARHEIENLHRLGVFDNLTLLKMWVEQTPRAIFPQRKIGQLQDGFEASFLALRANPIDDFSAIRDISARWKQGHFICLL